MEKAALDRQLKQVQSQTGRLTKDLEKKVRILSCCRLWFCAVSSLVVPALHPASDGVYLS